MELTKHSDINTYNLKSIDEKPNFYEEIFPYDELPKIIFDFKRVPMSLPDHIYITDTTFRDGEQSRVPYSIEQKLRLFDYLHKLAGITGIIEMTEFFLYTKKSRQAVKACLDRGYKYPRITGWIRANFDDLKLVKKMGLEETGILASISDYQIYYKMRKTKKEILGHYLRVVEETLQNNIIPRVHLEDITRADVQNVVLPFVQDLKTLSELYGLPVKLRLPDTLGLGLPYAETALPRSIPKLVNLLRTVTAIPSDWIEFHGHSDFHLSIANSMAAW
ncbi:MAG: 2-isopropylmalate synthase, partial [Candidatus Ranarchaeia archaeon]